MKYAMLLKQGSLLYKEQHLMAANQRHSNKVILLPFRSITHVPTLNKVVLILSGSLVKFFFFF